MVAPVTLESNLNKLFRLRKTDGEIGIELEVEGAPVHLDTLYWHTIPDGSLRNHGVEYVLRAPIMDKDLKEVMEEWKTGTKKSVFDPSIRCSTHIHVNASKHTLRQVYQVYTWFWLVENVLVEANGSERIGNLFCLRIKDAEDLFMVILQGLRKNTFFRHVAIDDFRYSALNPDALRKYGSYEFRFIKSLVDPDEIRLWAHNLYLGVTEAIKFPSASALLEIYRYQSPEAFLKVFFEEQFIRYLQDRVPNWIGLMEENFTYSHQLASLLDKKLKTHPLDQYKFQRPKIFSKEDLVVNIGDKTTYDRPPLRMNVPEDDQEDVLWEQEDQAVDPIDRLRRAFPGGVNAWVRQGFANVVPEGAPELQPAYEEVEEPEF